MLQILATAGYIFIQEQMQDFSAAPLKDEVVSAVEAQRIEKGKEEIAQNYEAVGIKKDQGKKSVDVLAQLNQELKDKAKKPDEEEQPKPKLDVESLGLDKVDEEKKPQKDVLIAKNLEDAESKEENKIKDLQDNVAEKNMLDKLNNKVENHQEKKAQNKESVPAPVVLSVPKQENNVAAQEGKKPEKSILDKVKELVKKPQEILHEKEQQKVVAEQSKIESTNKVAKNEATKEDIKNAKTKADEAKKKRLAELEEKRKKAEAEKKRLYEERLNRLRDKFLIKITDDKKPQEEDGKPQEATEEPDESEHLVLTQKKIPIKFIERKELPPPLMLRSQANDNRHHPIVLTDDDYNNILFDTIKIGEPSYFNAAYSKVRKPNLMNSSGDTLLTYALLLQKQEVVASILSNGADPDMPNQLGYRPLNIAIEFGDLRMVEMLVEFGADAKYIDPLGRSYLMQAARVGSLPIVDFLITQGTPINVLNNDGNSALGIAYRYRKDIIAKYLLKKGAKSWVDNSYFGAKQSLIKELENRWGAQDQQQVGSGNE